MRYVALVRGINVGGNNKVPMARLRSVLTMKGFTDVKSYIASGNILLTSDEQHPEAVRIACEEVLREEFSVETRVLVISQDQFLAIAQVVPDDWTNDGSQKSDVLFLFSEDDTPEILTTLAPKAEIDTARYVPGAVLWNVQRSNQSRSNLRRIVGTRTYRNLTIRNVNTVRKLAGMLVTN